MRVGFDLDGVLCEIDVASLYMFYEVLDDENKVEALDWYYRERKPLLDARLFLHEGDEMFIITSREESLREVTNAWVKKYYPNAQLLLLGQDKATGVDREANEKVSAKRRELKARAINILGIDVYFDDEAIEFEEFRKLCPNCKIIKYGGRLEI